MVFCVDCLLIAAAQFLAYEFRFEFSISPKEMHNLIYGVILIVPFKLIVFYFFNLYRGMWRYTGISDLLNLTKANVVATLIIIAVLVMFNRFHGISRSVFIIDGVICFLLTSSFRLLIRLYLSKSIDGSPVALLKTVLATNKHRSDVPTLVLGAGDAGEALSREITGNHHLKIHLVGFLDDDLSKIGRSVHGIPVLAPLQRLPQVVDKYGIKQIFIAMPSASANQIRRAVELCDRTRLTYKTLPSLSNLIDGSVSVKSLRDVNYEDLLGRPPVELDDESISQYLSGKTVLISGAGGSIGSELCRQIVSYHPAHVILLDNSEYNLFNIDAELRKPGATHLQASYLGRAQDRNLLDLIYKKHAPQIVFHAAACKHVHLVEASPWEGIFNNVIGSRVMMEAAVSHGAERFVMVSTDKAVRPASVMGACKRVAELIARSFNGAGTKIMTVRFGNVIGSSGSVMPVFRKQIQDGGPVTVTDENAERYFMTITEASRLILQAGALGKGGEIFILKMGTPVRIMQMAEDLIRLSGREPYTDVDIVVTGLREGEKLCEELIAHGENSLSTAHDKIMVLRLSQEMEISETDAARFAELLAALCDNARRCDSDGIKATLQEILPEYHPSAADGKH